MSMTDRQKRSFFKDGYLVLRRVVPASLIAEAKHVVNHSLGYAGIPPKQLPKMRAQTYCPEARQNAAITALLNDSPVFAALEEMMGAGNVVKAGGAQIALRFPGSPGDPVRPLRGHLDGLGSGLNGTEVGKYIRAFSALAVVLLSRVQTKYAGNFTVWPGSHRFYEAYFRRHGHGVLAQGMPPTDGLRRPVQLRGSPGDVILAHHQLVHAAAPNMSPDIRYAVIFRVHHKDCAANGNDAYTDIWREWPGIVAAHRIA